MVMHFRWEITLFKDRHFQLRRLRQETHEVTASVGCIMRPCLEKQTAKEKQAGARAVGVSSFEELFYSQHKTNNPVKFSCWREEDPVKVVFTACSTGDHISKRKRTTQLPQDKEDEVIN